MTHERGGAVVPPAAPLALNVRQLATIVPPLASIRLPPPGGASFEVCSVLSVAAFAWSAVRKGGLLQKTVGRREAGARLVPAGMPTLRAKRRAPVSGTVSGED